MVFALAGCQQGGQVIGGEPKTYPLGDLKVQFVPPPAPWVESQEVVGEDQADLGQPAERVLGIVFRKPDLDGIISVSSGEQNSNEAGELMDLENDQEMLNAIALWVVKRDGNFLTQEYIKVLDVNAFHMIFEFGDGASKEKGRQVHFTLNGRHYTLSMLVPAKDYNSEVGHFKNLLESFRLAE